MIAVMLLAAPAAAEPVNDTLAGYYGKRANWRKVRRDVLAWHKTTRNGCVAFVSTALRHVGVDIPVDAERDGWGVSRITFAFSDYLEQELHWTRSTDLDALRPGDVVFTTGWPDHVMVFLGWRDADARIARIADNKGFALARPLAPPPDSDLAGFAYALRAPPER